MNEGQALKATAQPTPPLASLTEIAEPPKKRQKSCSGDELPTSTQSTNPSSLLPAKPIHSQATKTFHPFFMSRTTSMESLGSTAGVPLLPLPQGKTVYLGAGPPASFPPKGMNHIYDRDPLTPATQQFHFKQKKGKTKEHQHIYDLSTYKTLVNLYPSVVFLPPEKLILPKSEIEDAARSLLSSTSHRALLRAFQILTRETQTIDPDGQLWTYKFRPRRADEVLCLGSSAIALRNWMTGDRKPISVGIPKEMDDFIVDDDGDMMESEYDSISEVDDSPQKQRRRKKKVQTFTAYENVVIITGPHGVGKSAAVFAVAEELGYQVFEISPGSRRGGKELMDAVGEVGQSELVTKHKEVTGAPSISPVNTGGETRKRPRKALICLDEIDILYEEDKGFWTCVTALVEKSRRPVIMTCNGNITSLFCD